MTNTIRIIVVVACLFVGVIIGHYFLPAKEYKKMTAEEVIEYSKPIMEEGWGIAGNKVIYALNRDGRIVEIPWQTVPMPKDSNEAR